MPTYLEYELEDGNTVLIEITEAETGGLVPASRGDEGPVIVRAKKSFSEAIAGAKAQAKLLLKEVEDLHVSEAEIKFGLTATGEVSNLAIGKLGLDVNYEVTLKWVKPQPAK